MNALVEPGTRIDLANCAAEPIHVPGSIQPHGALLAFTADGRLASHSANAAMLGRLPDIGQRLGDEHLTASIRSHLQARRDGVSTPELSEVELPDGRAADMTLHSHEQLLFAEVEPRAAGSRQAADFALLVQRALARVQAQTDIAALLEAGAEEIALLSGFDRVMAYRFHPDDSGEVVAERMARPMEPYLGMRYPASDIPAQARRLFVLNPVRLIVDVAYKPVPLVPDRNPATGRHIDLSHAVLRSVSPIHCEYLGNMGVHGSMAVSIVVQGRLWGMFACHHYSPHLASPAVRLACGLLSQVVSLMVERLLATRRSEAVTRGQVLRSAIIERVRADDYMFRALTSGKPAPRDVVPASGFAVSMLEQLHTVRETPTADGLARLLAWLDQRGTSSFATASIATDAPEIADACHGFAGLLAVRFSTERQCWLVWFRREQLQTLRWAGNPEKPATLGPNGMRLSPRGSFSEWQQVVRGQAEPWEEAELFEAEELRRALADVSATRLQEVMRARELLLAMLGHDLRNPVQAIAMAGATLRLDETRISTVQKQIATISGRMGRLINHVLDLSRVHAGLRLAGNRVPHDFTTLLDEIVAESRSSHPHHGLQTRYGALGMVVIDADRMAQVLGNLLSNARHHGRPDQPVVLEAMREGNELHVRVINHGSAITEEALQTLFEPFKRGSLDNPENPRGLGMGLYIAYTIVKEHHGSLTVSSGDGLVTFSVSLPLCGMPGHT